jgi:hypothetical protein
MLNFKFFNRDETENVHVKIESNNKTVSKIKLDADLDASKARVKTYNKSVTDNIKEKLMFQYRVGGDGFRGLHMAYCQENDLVNAICEDIAKEMGLLKELEGGNDE